MGWQTRRAAGSQPTTPPCSGWLWRSHPPADTAAAAHHPGEMATDMPSGPLVDMHGSSSNREGRSYTECKVTWHPPRMKKNPGDSGYFLYTSEGKGGAPDICQKTAAKVVGWYFGRLLPERKVAWAHQCQSVRRGGRKAGRALPASPAHLGQGSRLPAGNPMACRGRVCTTCFPSVADSRFHCLGTGYGCCIVY
jgi:hypothetical protein